MKKNKKKIFIMLMLLLSFLTLTVVQVHAVETYEKVVTFEILTLDEGVGTVTSGTYSKITQYINLELDSSSYYNVINMISLIYNDNEITNSFMSFNDISLAYLMGSDDDNPYINLINNDIFDDYNGVNVGDTFEITFEVESPGIVTGIIDTITSWISGFWGLILMTINSAVALFYTLPVGENPGGLTVIGILSLFGLGVGLVLYGIGFVTRMFKK